MQFNGSRQSRWSTAGESVEELSEERALSRLREEREGIAGIDDTIDTRDQKKRHAIPTTTILVAAKVDELLRA